MGKTEEDVTHTFCKTNKGPTTKACEDDGIKCHDP